jgi:hypothetical protein
MKTLKSSPVIIAALCLLLSCSKSDEFAVTDNGANSSSGLIDIGTNFIRLTVTYYRSEDCILEEIINLNDLLNSSEADHICLYSTDGQDLTLVPTVCDYLGIYSTNLIRITLPPQEFPVTDNRNNPKSGEIANVNNLMKLAVTYCRSEDCISEAIMNLEDLIKSSETDHICLYSKDGEDLTLVPTVCDYLSTCLKDIIGITLSAN